MKNYLRFLPIVTVILCLFYCVTLFAQETQQKWYNTGKYFLRAGYSFPTKDKFDGGLAASLGTTINLVDKLNFETEGYITLPQSVFISGEDSESIGAGDLKLISLNLNLNYYFISSDMLGIYLKAGAGYSFNIFSPTSAYNDLGFTIEEDLDNSVQFIFGLGTDYPLSDNIILNLDIRYSLNSISGTWSTRDEISGAEVSGNSKADLNFITIMLGIKIN